MATTPHPLVHHAAVSDPTKLNPNIKTNAFSIEITILEDTDQNQNLFPDLTASTTSWTFSPIVELDDDQYIDDSEEDDEDNEVDSEDDIGSDLDSEDEDDEDEDSPLVLLGKLHLRHLVNRDTIVQRALLSESAGVSVLITYRTPSGEQVFSHRFMGSVSEHLTTLSGSFQDTFDLSDVLTINVYDVNLWNPL